MDDSINLPERFRYVAIEGVIGAGKTTLAQMLAAEASARAVLEEFEQNPFLDRFYEDPERWAFQTQLAFLASRFRQQKALAHRDLFHQQVISDYSFDKDRIFARVTLDGEELRLYESLYLLMEVNAPAPDLIIYVRSSVERLLHNIRTRDRSYERSIDADYLTRLSKAYDEHFWTYTRGPLLIVNASRIDFVNEPDHFRELLRRIGQVKEGLTVFEPPSDMQLSFG